LIFDPVCLLNASLRERQSEQVDVALRAFARQFVHECHHPNMSVRLLPGFTVTFFLFLSDGLLRSWTFRYAVVATFEVNRRLTHDIADRPFYTGQCSFFNDSFALLLAAMSPTTSNPVFATQYLLANLLCVRSNKWNDELLTTFHEHGHATTALIRIIVFVQSPTGVATIRLSSHSRSLKMTTAFLMSDFL